jgi:plastocyanin
VRWAALACVASSLALALGPAADLAAADQQIDAGPGTQYLTTSVTMAQGERLTFRNLDMTGHDVTARRLGADRRPLFGTPVLATGSTAFVGGSQYLTTGRYDFYCSVHPFMHGTLAVTAAGRPAKRPPGDSRAPGVAVEIVSGKIHDVARSGKLTISFHTDEGATVRLSGGERVGKRAFALLAASRQVAANRPVRLTLKLSSDGRKALAGARKAWFRVAAVTRDAAGNQGSGGARRTLGD